MEFRRLGKTDITVSSICLGTMTWGEQNTEAEAHQQLDYATDFGVNFIDTAEMYAVPPSERTCGKTEEFIGTWLVNKQRDKIISATKVVGKSLRFPYIRGGLTRLNRQQMTEALEGSLKRLKTDYVDLYQLHWPERQTNCFGVLGYKHNEEDVDVVPIEETLQVLQDFVKQGKVRHIGISNETPWGMHEFLRLAETKNMPRIQSIQNPYSLLNRSFEIGLAEMSIREQVGLLAYSPLAFGVLSGKYLGGKNPKGSRLSEYSTLNRYKGELAEKAAAKYVDVAKKFGLSPVQMALSFVTSQPFVTSNIIGATSLEQLEENLKSSDVRLSVENLNELEKIHTETPNPCP